MSHLEGCNIEPLDREACRAVLEWIAGGAEPAWGCDGLTWLLAHCRDGVSWGRLDSSTRVWRLSSSPFPDFCPVISQDNVMEVRLFGPSQEIMVWRTEEGFLGRLLVDEPNQDNNSPTRPDDEIRIMLADRLVDGPKDGFSRVGTAAGTEQAVPLACTVDGFSGGQWPLRLKVRHYFEKDQETSAIRVAASRLVDVFKEVP